MTSAVELGPWGAKNLALALVRRRTVALVGAMQAIA